MKPTLGLDCDGVVADMNGYVLRIVNEELGTDFTVDDWNTWEISKCLGDAAREIHQRLLGQNEIWANLPLYPGLPVILSQLNERFNLIMVSAVWHRFAHIRRAWVTANNLPFSQVIASSDKAGVAANYGMIGFIEDRQEQARGVAEAGIQSYLIARPYNVEEAGIFRGSWEQIIQHLFTGNTVATLDTTPD